MSGDTGTSQGLLKVSILLDSKVHVIVLTRITTHV